MTAAADYISNQFKAINSQETIAQVQDFFSDLPFSHFPVIEEGVYIGSLALDDIETFDSDKKVADYSYTFERFFARKNALWLDVLNLFSKNNTNIIPVLDQENTYVGYYESEIVVQLFQETPFLKEEGNIIVVQKPLMDYSMSQIAQIVESNNAKLLGLFVSEANLETAEITLKINLGSLNEIIQSFRRYGYEIISEHQEDRFIGILKERSEYLDKYLNI